MIQLIHKSRSPFPAPIFDFGYAGYQDDRGNQIIVETLMVNKLRESPKPHTRRTQAAVLAWLECIMWILAALTVATLFWLLVFNAIDKQMAFQEQLAADRACVRELGKEECL